MRDNTDALRKQYGRITPFKRAAMIMQAAERMDQEVVDALKPVTLQDAFHVTTANLSFSMLAFKAIYESQRCDALFWGSMAILKQQQAIGKREGETDPKTLISQIRDGQIHARAWLLALEALDKETGGACMSFARVFAPGYIQYIMERGFIMMEGTTEIDYSDELEQLRDLWGGVGPETAGGVGHLVQKLGGDAYYMPEFHA